MGGTWSNKNSFTTVAANLLAPTLNTPGNGTTGASRNPVFSWSQVSGNVGYRIIVATNPADLPTEPATRFSASSWAKEPAG